MNIKPTLLLGVASFAFAFAANAGTLPHAHAKTTKPSAATTSALDGVYVKAGAGFTKFGKFKETKDHNSYVNKSPKSAPMFHVGVGYKFTDALRSDLTFHYGKISYKGTGKTETHTRTASQKITTMAAMVNGYYDFNMNEMFTPYVTAGVGLGQNQSKNLSVVRAQNTNLENKTTTPLKAKKSKIAFVWNGGAGVLLNISKNFAVDVGYRYMDLGRISVKDSLTPEVKGSKQNIKGHQGLVSLVYKF